MRFLETSRKINHKRGYNYWEEFASNTQIFFGDFLRITGVSFSDTAKKKPEKNEGDFGGSFTQNSSPVNQKSKMKCSPNNPSTSGGKYKNTAKNIAFCQNLCKNVTCQLKRITPDYKENSDNRYWANSCVLCYVFRVWSNHRHHCWQNA